MTDHDMNLDTFLQRLNDAPEQIEFEETMAVIEGNYAFTPSAFRNGGLSNEAGQNSGSCKLFGFAQLQGLSPQQTLACFGRYYREDVLQHPDGSDHQNIRNFMQSGWEGITFEGQPLTRKPL